MCLQFLLRKNYLIIVIFCRLNNCMTRSWDRPISCHLLSKLFKSQKKLEKAKPINLKKIFSLKLLKIKLINICKKYSFSMQNKAIYSNL